jgi:hypothetical protein
VLVHSSNTSFAFDLDGRNLIVLGTSLKVVSISPISNTVEYDFPSLEVTMLVQGSLTRSLSNFSFRNDGLGLPGHTGTTGGSELTSTSADLVVPSLEATVFSHGLSVNLASELASVLSLILSE